MNKIYWIAFISIFKKEMNRFIRLWIQTLMPPVITITLYLIIFGNLLGTRLNKIYTFNYLHFIVPGMILMAVITNSYANVASSFFSARFQRNIEELLVAPVPTHIIILGYIGGGIARGVLVGLLVTMISLFFVKIKIYSWLIIIFTLLLTAVIFSLGGLLNALFASNFDDISLIPTFILTPLTYLGGVFYSINQLPLFWKNFSKFNPIVYVVSSFRYGFLGITEVPLILSLLIVIILIVLLYLISWILIDRGYGLKN
ncbi:MAG: ABC transporter permease [Candidatus Dasytiphilus stammeri]